MDVDGRRYELIDLFKADLGIPVQTRHPDSFPAGPAPG